MRPLRKAAAAAAAILGLAAGGCATVMSEGTGNALHADAQRTMAASIEGGLAPFRELVAGQEVAVRVVAGRNDAAAQYARSCLVEMIAAGGGRYAGESGGRLGLEIYAARAGTRAIERNLVINASQYVRVPIFYGERFGGEAQMVVVARDAAGNLVPRPAPRGESGESEYYIFRMIGPFRR